MGSEKQASYWEGLLGKNGKLCVIISQISSLKNSWCLHQASALQEAMYLLIWVGLPSRPNLATWPAHDNFSPSSKAPMLILRVLVSALALVRLRIWQANQSSVPSLTVPTKQIVAEVSWMFLLCTSGWSWQIYQGDLGLAFWFATPRKREIVDFRPKGKFGIMGTLG